MAATTAVALPNVTVMSRAFAGKPLPSTVMAVPGEPLRRGRDMPCDTVKEASAGAEPGACALTVSAPAGAEGIVTVAFSWPWSFVAPPLVATLFPTVMTIPDVLAGNPKPVTCTCVPGAPLERSSRIPAEIDNVETGTFEAAVSDPEARTLCDPPEVGGVVNDPVHLP